MILNHETAEVLVEKLTRPDGLCTSVCKTDEENAWRIKAILDAYLAPTGSLQRAHRAADDWEYVEQLPVEFGSYRYRVSQ